MIAEWVIPPVDGEMGRSNIHLKRVKNNMERGAFIFYKSFYEAAKDLPKDIKLEVLTVIIEYALYGIQSEDMKPFAKGIFSLIKPIIDKNNTRYKNGTHGATSGKLGGRPKKNAANTPPAPDVPPPYSQSFADEVKQMKEEAIWLEPVCMQFHITKKEALKRLDRFQRHCDTECCDKPHESLADAKRHFCSWMRKSYQQQVQMPPMDEPQPEAPPEYTYSGGFGSIDV